MAAPAASADCPPWIIQPTAAFDYAPAAPQAGEVVAFDASASTPGSVFQQIDIGAGICIPGGGYTDPITSYDWDFGDGSAVVSSASPTVDHTFAAAGDYLVSLAVRGLWTYGLTTKTVTISPAPAPDGSGGGGGTTTGGTTTGGTTTGGTTTGTGTPSTSPAGTTDGTAEATAPSLRSYGYYCRRETKRHVRGRRRTPFAACVVAMKRLARGTTTSPRVACRGELKRRVRRMRRTPFAECVRAGRALLADLRG